MDATDISQAMEAHRQAGERYHEFIRSQDLSVGLYVLRAGAADPQLPHNEDEVYYIVEGRGVIQVGEEEQGVSAGSIVFVGAQVEHRFHSITEDLTILVVFAPPRRSRALPA
jgi:mannose-6-phosphate isomerase-like protein (cupin superfamily)